MNPHRLYGTVERCQAMVKDCGGPDCPNLFPAAHSALTAIALFNFVSDSHSMEPNISLCK
eukprot:scaffold26748_cov18-Prasinocladus_malaysianus.AAC.2